ncbi:50S ribosomal protein L15 [Candidatus Gracilibacteria bacterium]|nr:50S ribosomal protein L15 [Candidatus Gracilibacteria bacterium]
MLSISSIRPNKGSNKKKRIVGRGDSSGHGSYSTRGMKGQNSRSGGGTKPGFEGGQTPLIRRLPKLKGFKNPNRVPFQVVNVSALNVFDNGAKVDIIALYEERLVQKKNAPVKILGDGELEKKLTIKVDACSESARTKIEAKGGTVDVPTKKEKNAE